MSFRKKNHILSREEVLFLEREITAKISDVLRLKFKGNPTAVKNIANETGIALATVKKWYEGQNPPSLGHFLILCRHYDEILKAFLSLSGTGYSTALIHSNGETKQITQNHEQGVILGKDDPKNVTINVTIKSLSERQRWFLDRVYRRIAPSIEEFVDRWGTTERTARRDIAELLRLKQIKRVGAKKNGRYEIV